MEALRKFGSCCGLLSRTGFKGHSVASFQLWQPKRSFAEPGNLIKVEQDSVHKEIAILEMNHKPFNGFNKRFMDEFNNTLEHLENSDTCRGVILASAIPSIFSAGLDITQMYQKPRDHTAALWDSLHEFSMRLYGTSLVTVAAVNGHATAGGCLISLSCDYRIMVEGKYNVGFSANRLGVVTPFWVQEIMKKACGERIMEMSFQKGTLFVPDEALAIGLADELVAREELMRAARTQILKWLEIPDHARVTTKRMLRMPLIEKARSTKDAEIAYFTNFLERDAVQKAIGSYLEKLKKKK